MNTYNSKIFYKKGEEMRADYLSCYVEALLAANKELSHVRRYLVSQELPSGR